MKILSYNIQFGRGLDRVYDLKRICETVKSADIICLQEVDAFWQRSGNVDQPELISELLPEFYSVFGASFDVDNSYKNQQGRVVNQRRRHGDMILSRWPIVSSRTFNLPKKHYADKFNMQMGFIEAVIQTETESLRIYNYHAGYQDIDERLEQIQCFGRIYRQSPREQGAWSGKADIDGDDWGNQTEAPMMPTKAIVCGDFNASYETAEYQYLIEQCGLTDCWRQLDPDNINTGTLKHEPTADIKISGKVDHILVSEELLDRVRSVAIDHEADGSDHKPVSCVIDV